MKRFWRVKYGFEKQDVVSIPEEQLEKAIYAQVARKPVQLGNHFVNGANIISISPHWHKHTGWNDWYEPTDGEDWKQIKRDCPNYDGVLEEVKNKVAFLMQNGRTQEIGKNVLIPELENKERNISTEFSKQLAEKMKVKNYE